MAYTRIKLKDFPDLKRLVRLADPSYKKHEATVWASPTVALYGRYWSGGTKHEYTAVDLHTGQVSHAPEARCAILDAENATVTLPQGVVIISTGFFCGKAATASIHVHPEDMPKVLPAP